MSAPPAATLLWMGWRVYNLQLPENCSCFKKRDDTSQEKNNQRNKKKVASVRPGKVRYQNCDQCGDCEN